MDFFTPQAAKKYGNNTPYYPNNSNTPIGESRSDGFMGFGRGTGMVLNNVKARISKPTLSPPKSLATKYLRNSNRPNVVKTIMDFGHVNYKIFLNSSGDL